MEGEATRMWMGLNCPKHSKIADDENLQTVINKNKILF